jgi:hypothetical protein
MHLSYAKYTLEGKYNIKLKLPKNKEFLDYCKACFNVAMSTVYHYLDVYYLYEEYPSILSCGFGVTELYKNKELMCKSANNDNELKTLLTHFLALVYTLLI